MVALPPSPARVRPAGRPVWLQVRLVPLSTSDAVTVIGAMASEYTPVTLPIGLTVGGSLTGFTVTVTVAGADVRDPSFAV